MRPFLEAVFFLFTRNGKGANKVVVPATVYSRKSLSLSLSLSISSRYFRKHLRGCCSVLAISTFLVLGEKNVALKNDLSPLSELNERSCVCVRQWQLSGHCCAEGRYHTVVGRQELTHRQGVLQLPHTRHGLARANAHNRERIVSTRTPMGMQTRAWRNFWRESTREEKS